MDAEIQDVPLQPTLVQRFRVAPDQIGGKLAQVLPAVFNYAMSKQLGPGQPFVRYLAVGAELDVEAGVPVTEHSEGDGATVGSSLPAGRTAVTTHRGPYTELSSTHEALQAWVKGQGLEPAGGAWEVYITDPTEEPDESSWLTKVYLPLAP